MIPPARPSDSIRSSSFDEAIRVLMVEDSDDYAALVRTTLEKSTAGSFEVEHAPRLDTALGHLEERSYDAMLLDLSLPDGYGAFTIGSACALSTHLPVIVLTGTEDEALAMAAVKAGAQDYLVKDRLDRRELPATILHAIERHRRMEKMFDIREREKRTQRGARINGTETLRDSVTGIANEIVLCDRLTHAVARASRTGAHFALVMLEFDEFDMMASYFGSRIRNEILSTAALRLEKRIRKSDTLARIGSDGFAVILEDIVAETDIVRVVANLLGTLGRVEVHDGSGLAIEGISASAGISIFPGDGADIETLIENAEEARNVACGAGGGQYRLYRHHALN